MAASSQAGERSGPGVCHLRQRQLPGALPGKALRLDPERDLRASPAPVKTWPKESAPQNRAKNLFNQISHLRPHPRERWIVGTPAAGAQPPHVLRRHVVKISGLSCIWSDADSEDGSLLWGTWLSITTSTPRPFHPIPPQAVEAENKVACSRMSLREDVYGQELPEWFFQGFVALSWPLVLEFGEVEGTEGRHSGQRMEELYVP